MRWVGRDKVREACERARARAIHRDRFRERREAHRPAEDVGRRDDALQLAALGSRGVDDVQTVNPVIPEDAQHLRGQAARGM